MKKLNTIIFSLLIMLLASVPAFAEPTIINETADNYDPEHAVSLMANRVTAASTVNASYSGQYVAQGSISDQYDADWYKVYLNANSNTVLSVNSPDLSYSGVWEIFPEDQYKAPLITVTHIQNYNRLGVTPYYVNIPADGYYYVKVSSPVATGSYKFTIGGCNYDVDNYTYNASSPLELTTSISSAQDSYNLRYANVPDNSIVYNISVGGRKVNRASYEERYVKLSSDYSWTKTNSYSYASSISVYLNKPLKDVWMLKIEGNVASYARYYDLTPSLLFSYVYPVLPQ